MPSAGHATSSMSDSRSRGKWLIWKLGDGERPWENAYLSVSGAESDCLLHCYKIESVLGAGEARESEHTHLAILKPFDPRVLAISILKLYVSIISSLVGSSTSRRPLRRELSTK